MGGVYTLYIGEISQCQMKYSPPPTPSNPTISALAGKPITSPRHSPIGSDTRSPLASPFSPSPSLPPPPPFPFPHQPPSSSPFPTPTTPPQPPQTPHRPPSPSPPTLQNQTKSSTPQPPTPALAIHALGPYSNGRHASLSRWSACCGPTLGAKEVGAATGTVEGVSVDGGGGGWRR